MTLKKSSYIHLAIMFILAFGISYLPPFGQVTPFGMKALAVFISVLYGWIFFDLFWTSIFGFMIIPVLGLNTVAASFATGLGNQMIINVLLCMAFAVAIDMAGVTDIMANWLLQRKILHKSPWCLVIGILLIGALIGSVGPALAAVFLLWGITIKIANFCGIKKGDPILSFMIMMITVFTMSASFILPFRGSALIYSAYLMQVTDVGIPTGSFIIYALITISLLYILIILAAKFILRIDASKFVLPEQVLSEIKNAKSTKNQKMSLIVLLIYVLVLLIPSLFTSLPGATFINTLGVGGISAIALLVLGVLNYNGESLISLQKVFARLDWSLFFLLAVTYPIADLLKSADSGIMPTIMATVRPIVATLGAVPFMIVSMIILGLITQVTHNIVLGAMFMPFLLPLCQSIGGNMYTLWFMLFITLNMAYCTPAGSFQAALVFGHEQMERKHAYLYSIILLIVTFIVYAVVGIPLGNVVFGSLV